MPKNEFDDEDDRPRKPRRPRDEDDPPRRAKRRDDEDDRPRRESRAPSNGVATAALVLGILSLCMGLLTGLPAIVCGFLGMSRAKTTGVGKGMAVTGLLLGTFTTVLALAWVAFLVYLMQKGDLTKIAEDLSRGGTLTDRETSGKMKKLALATHQYHDAGWKMPNNVAPDELPGMPRPRDRWTPNQPPNQKGAPPFPTFLRSWRVELLPHVGEAQLYAQFKMDQPWNSPANKPHADRRIDAYADSATVADTRFRGLTGSGTVFEPYARIPLVGISDGTSNTILFVEATDTAPWAEGNDLRYDAGWPEPPTPTPLPAIGRPGAGTALIAMCDGSVRRLNKNIDPIVFRRLAGRADGMVIDANLLAVD